ncbi:hypothetical protein PG995_009698 [Apiospora arundinis]
MTPIECDELTPRQHMSFPSQCGICCEEVVHKEQVVVLLSNNSHTSFARLVGPFPYPDPDSTTPGCPSPAAGGFYVCFDPVCQERGKGKEDRECAGIHWDCCKLYLQHCLAADKLDRLWTAVCWRHVWARNTPIPWIGARPPPLNKDALGLLRWVFGAQSWILLPPELLLRIQFLSRGTFIWQCIAAVEMAGAINNAKPEALTEVPISRVVAWQRGGGKIGGESETEEDPIIRIRIDDVGISHIERLLRQPRFTGETTPKNTACIVLTPKQYESIVVQFKNQHARLKVPHGITAPMIYDTLEPLDLSSLHTCYFKFGSSERQQIIRLDKVSGITLFFHHGLLVAVHGHDENSPSAKTTFNRLKLPSRGHIDWDYVPLAPNDEVTAFGIRPRTDGGRLSTAVLIRTKLRGDMIYGALIEHYIPQGDKMLNEGTGMALVCVSSARTEQLLRIGAYCHQPIWSVGNQLLSAATTTTTTTTTVRSHQGEDMTPFRVAQPLRTVVQPLWISTDDMTNPIYYASVTLSPTRCRSVEVFEERRQTQWGMRLEFAGAVFRFEDGGAQAVGQCRPGVDASKMFRNPAHILWEIDDNYLDHDLPFQPSEFGAVNYLLHLRFLPSSDSGLAENGVEPGWFSKPLGKRLDFWWAGWEQTVAFGFAMDGPLDMGSLSGDESMVSRDPWRSRQ